MAATPRLKPPAPVERQQVRPVHACCRRCLHLDLLGADAGPHVPPAVQATSAADCCVGGGGRVTARVAVDRAWCKRGGAVAVTLEVDNASSAAVRGVRLALTQAMDIEPAKHDDCFFGTGRGIRRLVEHALPGVPPRTRAKGAAAM